MVLPSRRHAKSARLTCASLSVRVRRSAHPASTPSKGPLAMRHVLAGAGNSIGRLERRPCVTGTVSRSWRPSARSLEVVAFVYLAVRRVLEPVALLSVWREKSIFGSAQPSCDGLETGRGWREHLASATRISALASQKCEMPVKNSKSGPRRLIDPRRASDFWLWYARFGVVERKFWPMLTRLRKCPGTAGNRQRPHDPHIEWRGFGAGPEPRVAAA